MFDPNGGGWQLQAKGGKDDIYEDDVWGFNGEAVNLDVCHKWKEWECCEYM